jgi:glycosyltransferase involved in cell wall biosynthesis
VANDREIDKSSARMQMGLKPDDFVLLFFGIITKYKGLNVLLEAMSDIKSNIKNHRLVIAGRVDEKYKPEFDTLLTRYKSLNVTVNNGFIEEGKVQQHFKSADVTVLPYLEASQSGVMFHSYTYGVPVIAPDLGGFSDDILQGKTGYLFEAGNAASLSQTIMKLYNEMDFRSSEITNFIKEFSHENYSWVNTGKVLIHTYTELHKAVISATI